jgi:hypothetical protein
LFFKADVKERKKIKRPQNKNKTKFAIQIVLAETFEKKKKKMGRATDAEREFKNGRILVGESVCTDIQPTVMCCYYVYPVTNLREKKHALGVLFEILVRLHTLKKFLVLNSLKLVLACVFGCLALL